MINILTNSLTHLLIVLFAKYKFNIKIPIQNIIIIFFGKLDKNTSILLKTTSTIILQIYV
jgi:hypothetical protein